MKSLLVLGLAMMLSRAGAQNPEAPPARPLPLRAKLTDEVIKDAVRQTLAGDKKASPKDMGTVLGAEKYEEFSRQFSDAKLPDCLHSEGLKYQPTFFLGGVLALPFIVVAAARGKCR
jgi:hypothetical protein